MRKEITMGVAKVITAVGATAATCGLIVFLRSPYLQKGYYERRSQSLGQVIQVPQGQANASVLLDLLSRLESSEELNAFYDRLRGMTKRGNFGSLITVRQVEQARRDPTVLFSIVSTLRQIAGRGLNL